MATAVGQETTVKVPQNIDDAAQEIGSNITEAQNNLMGAYALKEGADQATLKKLAKDLGLNVGEKQELSVKSLQLVAEQRFQQSSSVASLFSNLVEKLNQLKQQIINNVRN